MKIEDIKVGDNIYCIEQTYNYVSPKYNNNFIESVRKVEKVEKNRIYTDGNSRNVYLIKNKEICLLGFPHQLRFKHLLETSELIEQYKYQKEYENKKTDIRYNIDTKCISISDLEQINEILSKYE